MYKIGLAICLAIASLLFFTQSNYGQNKNSSSNKGSDDFPQKAYSGGMLEIQLGKLAQQKASSEKVKQFGERMVADHSNANKELKDIADKNNISLPDNMLDENKDVYDKLNKYNGAKFDKEYMDQMVMDHKKVISDFEGAVKNADNQDIKQWVINTLPTVKQHLKMAEQIRKSLNSKSE